MCTSSVSNVIYHKFSHGAAFYTLNGKNVNVMLEYLFIFLFCFVFVLTLKPPVTTAAVDIHKYFIVFSEKVSSESSARIHMKNQALFSSKDKGEKK